MKNDKLGSNNENLNDDVVIQEDDQCDIYISKICDNCGECLGLDGSDFKVVRIDAMLNPVGQDAEIIAEETYKALELDEYLLEDVTLERVVDYEEEGTFDVDYIEDIPELKEEHERKINKLLGRE